MPKIEPQVGRENLAISEEVLNTFGKYCLIETKPLSDLPSNNVIDLQSKIQEELSKDPPVYVRDYGVLMIAEFLLCELS